eukprot:CAMPEP_0197434112 /NCGR_PEP_ID=MMETSP1175-20131217/1875_1 /TAXON_ID=1003142 /ORGANISM="Triceratium dubium, Strain CCMP147" /LENGTH=214 /DNA_ID=CAMNT_0042962705 /DNA_START=42 /DNA_END=686 /DNA_ORIENTATION=+
MSAEGRIDPVADETGDGATQPKNARKRKAVPAPISSPPALVPAAAANDRDDNKKCKFTLRYNPDDIKKMTREELSEWRKQQRKERNRASAAASREKTRGRIRELEGEVDDLKTKYAAALEKIQALEEEKERNRSLASLCPQTVPDRIPSGTVSPPAVVFAEDSPVTFHPTNSFDLQVIPSSWALRDPTAAIHCCVNDVNKKNKPHLIETNSRQA